MNILHIESFFHPDAGYQLNILAKYMAAKGHKVTIITGEIDKFPAYLTDFFGCDNITKRDNNYYKQYNVKIIRVPVYWYYSGRAFFSDKYFKEIEKIGPDVVFAHGNDDITSIRTIRYCVKHHIPVVSDTHMTDVASKNRFRKLFRFYYRHFETPIILKNKIPIIRTAEVDFVCRAYGIPLSQCPVISFGSDVMLFKPDEVIKNKLRKELGLSEGTFLFVYAGKLDESKGGLFFANSIKEKFNVKKEICFLVIGNLVGSYGEGIKRAFEESENKVILLPTKKYMDLASYFTAADVALIPKQCSLTFYDYQACALPVIAEDNEGNRTRVLCDNGLLFKADSINDFRYCIEEMVKMETSKFKQVANNARSFIVRNYNYDTKCDDYLSVLEKEVKRYKNSSSAISNYN